MKDKEEKIMNAWLVWYSEYEIHPTCLFYEPFDLDKHYRVDKIKVVHNPKEL